MSSRNSGNDFLFQQQPLLKPCAKVRTVTFKAILAKRHNRLRDRTTNEGQAHAMLRIDPKVACPLD